jgi:hypothetical protein
MFVVLIKKNKKIVITHIILEYFNVLFNEYYHINMTNQCGHSSTGLHLLSISSAINENNTKFWKGHLSLIWLCRQIYFPVLYTENIPQFGNNIHSRIIQSRTIDPCVRYTKYPSRISLLISVVLYIYIKFLGSVSKNIRHVRSQNKAMILKTFHIT